MHRLLLLFCMGTAVLCVTPSALRAQSPKEASSQPSDASSSAEPAIIPCGDGFTFCTLANDSDRLVVYAQSDAPGPGPDGNPEAAPAAPRISEMTLGKPSTGFDVRNPRGVFLISTEGSAWISTDRPTEAQVRSTPLTPFSQITGKLRFNGNPAGPYRIEVMWSPYYYDQRYDRLPQETRRRLPPRFAFRTATWTDTEGRFELARVPRGPVLLTISLNLPDDSQDLPDGSSQKPLPSAVGLFHREFIEVAPGKNDVEIEVSGRVVEGTVNLSQAARSELTHVENKGVMSARRGQAAVMFREVAPLPQSRSDDDAARQILRDALNPTLAAAPPRLIQVLVDPQGDGNFKFFIPSGTYDVQVQPWFAVDAGYMFSLSLDLVNGPRTVEVESVPGDSPLNLGELQVIRREADSGVRTATAKTISRAEATRIFEQQQAERAKQLDDLQTRLDRARQLLSRRQQRRDEIIQRIQREGVLPGADAHQ